MARGRRLALILAAGAMALGSLAAAGCGATTTPAGHLRRRLRQPVRRHPDRRLLDRRPASSAAAEAFAARTAT